MLTRKLLLPRSYLPPSWKQAPQKWFASDLAALCAQKAGKSWQRLVNCQEASSSRSPRSVLWSRRRWRLWRNRRHRMMEMMTTSPVTCVSPASGIRTSFLSTWKVRTISGKPSQLLLNLNVQLYCPLDNINVLSTYSVMLEHMKMHYNDAMLF